MSTYSEVTKCPRPCGDRGRIDELHVIEMLCNLCQSIDFSSSPIYSDAKGDISISDVDRGKEYFAYQHHASIEALRASAFEGCHLCCQIREELLHIRGHERDDEYHRGPIEIRHYRKAGVEGDFVIPTQVIIVAKTPIRNVKLLFDVVQYSDSLTALLNDKILHESHNTGCEGNFHLAMKWLNQCLSSHVTCSLSMNLNPSLPSRVLDVRIKQTSNGVSLCSGNGRYGPYVTLSHVWGKAQVITTTLLTIGARMTNIEMKDLPQTFQDAVIVARNMNVRYLWIDSICIIQDSFDDWAKESSRMGEYYTNSLFNICAVSATDGSVGCFMARNPLQTTPCQVDIRLPGVMENKPKTVFLRPSSGWDPVNQTAGFQRPPLWQRAWVVQERLLSPRLLQFSSMQLSWKCRTMVASETIPEGIHDLSMSKGDDVLLQALIGLKSFEQGVKDIPISLTPKIAIVHGTTGELIGLYNAWYDLVSLYGKCILTKESDIFPAISGIAKAIATSTGDRYVAGLWEHDLHRGLIWSAPDSTSSKHDLRRYRAPSWSWASLKATCTFLVREISQAGLKIDKDHFKIDSIVSTGSEISPFGEITEARLHITGLLKKAHPKGSDDEMPFKVISSGHDRFSLFDLEANRDVGYYFPDNIDRMYLTEIWCCPVMTEEEEDADRSNSTSSFTHHSSRTIEARCLALVALSPPENLYMRVGNVWVKDFAWFNDCKPTQFSIA